MTETVTKEHTEVPGMDEDLLTAAARAESEAAAKSLATIRPEQQTWDEDQLAILRALGIEDAGQGDLNLFFHYCRTTGLDPFRKQIYMIGRNTKVSEWVDDERAQNGRRKVEKWVTKWTIQTGIDGYRKNGREAAKRYVDSLSFEGPFFTGEDDFHVTDDGQVIQHWRKVWPKGRPPHAARFVVWRAGEEFEGIAHYDEFVQTGYSGEPNSMWAKMPRNQLAKCAEALAWRRAYPDDFAGLILEDSAQPTIIDTEGNVESGPEKRRTAGGSGIGGVRAARERKQQQRQAAADVIDGEVVADEPAEAPEPAEDAPADTEPRQSDYTIPESDLRKSVRQKLNGVIFATFGELKMNGDTEEARRDRLVVIREIVGREIESSKELTDDELQTLRNSLLSRKQAGTLDADVTEWLNIETLRQDAAEEAAAEPDNAEPGAEWGIKAPGVDQ